MLLRLDFSPVAYFPFNLIAVLDNITSGPNRSGFAVDQKFPELTLLWVRRPSFNHRNKDVLPLPGFLYFNLHLGCDESRFTDKLGDIKSFLSQFNGSLVFFNNALVCGCLVVFILE